MMANASVDGDFRFDNLRFVINDLLNCTDFSVSSPIIDELAAIASAAYQSNPEIKIAFVVTAQELIDLAKHYAESPLNFYPTRIFSTQEEARQWLNLQ